MPVDFIVDAIAAAAGDPAAGARRLHLVDPEPVTAAELSARSRASTPAGTVVRVPPELDKNSLRISR